jgi:hypothetical protein
MKVNWLGGKGNSYGKRGEFLDAGFWDSKGQQSVGA